MKKNKLTKEQKNRLTACGDCKTRNDFIKKLIALRGTTQAEISRKNKISLTNLNKVIKDGRNTPGYRKILSKELNMPVYVLFERFE